MFLPDINVWLALAFRFHSHHLAANVWYEGSTEPCCFRRFTQQGFLRLASNSAAFKEEAVSLREAWRMYDTILRDRRVVFAEESEGVDTYWRAFTQRRSFSPKVWGDAYLAAFARAASLELVTFDQGLRQYRRVTSIILS
jgi:toxin-antitoxin system PIN domain toxin